MTRRGLFQYIAAAFGASTFGGKLQALLPRKALRENETTRLMRAYYRNKGLVALQHKFTFRDIEKDGLPTPMGKTIKWFRYSGKND